MPSKSAFEGKRLAFLSGEKKRYYGAIKNMIGQDIVKDIQQKYLLRFNIDLPSTEEPSDEFLETIDDSKPAPEYPVPDPEALSEAEYEKENAKWKGRQKRVKAKKRVSHMEVIDEASTGLTSCKPPSANQAMAGTSVQQGKHLYTHHCICQFLIMDMFQDNNEDPSSKSKSGGNINAYTAFWAKLTGVKLNKPRHASAKMLFLRTVIKELEEKTNRSWKTPEMAGMKRVQVWNIQLDLMWATVTKQEKEAWQKKSDSDYDRDTKEWDALLKAPVAKEPEQLQKCVSNATQQCQY